MHDGRFAMLEEVVPSTIGRDFQPSPGQRRFPPEPTETEQDVVAFLRSLNGEGLAAGTRPIEFPKWASVSGGARIMNWSPRVLPPCFANACPVWVTEEAMESTGFWLPPYDDRRFRWIGRSSGNSPATSNHPIASPHGSMAAGISGLTGIVGTFFVKDYLGLSAAFLAALGFLGRYSWALRCHSGHLAPISRGDGRASRLLPGAGVVGGPVC